MKIPRWFRTALAEQAPRLVAGDITRAEAIAAIKNSALDHEDEFPEAIWTDFIDRQLSAWEKQHRPYVADETSGQGDLFPELPGWLETGIGKRTHQSVMTARDWDAGLKQAETKASNVTGYLDRYRAAYDQVRPRFTNEEQTTSDVWKPALGAVASS